MQIRDVAIDLDIFMVHLRLFPVELFLLAKDLLFGSYG